MADGASTHGPLDLHLPVLKLGHSGDGPDHRTSADGRSTAADCTRSGSTGDGGENVSEPDAVGLSLLVSPPPPFVRSTEGSSLQTNITRSRKDDDHGAVHSAATTLQSFAALTEWLGDVRRRGAPQSWESQLQSSSESPPSVLTSTHAALAPAGHANTSGAGRDTFDGLRQENDSLRAETSAMRAQIANLEAKNAAETSVLRAQITEILDRLNALSPSQGMYHYSHVPCYHEPLISLDSQPRKDSNIALDSIL